MFAVETCENFSEDKDFSALSPQPCAFASVTPRPTSSHVGFLTR